jgi:hypothetical protein
VRRGIRISFLIPAALAALAGLAACQTTNSGLPPAGVPGAAATTSQPGGTGRAGADQSSSFGLSDQCPAAVKDPAVHKLSTDQVEVPLPAGFRAVEAVRCRSGLRTVPGNGVWQTDEADVADSGLAPLVAALELPSAPKTESVCSAVGFVLPNFALVDASGAIVRPKLPEDGCGEPLQQALTALSALPWRTEADQITQQIQTQEESDTGCQSAYKYLFGRPQVDPALVPWNKEHPTENIAPATVCVYTVPSTHTPTGTPGGAPVVVGTFAHGVKLTPSQQAAIAAVLNQTSDTAAPACATPATRFAELIAPDTLNVALELDGCHRLQWPNAFISSAPASLLQALAAAGIS